MAQVSTLGQLVMLAKANNVEPGKFEGGKYYTLVLDKDGLRLETTTEADFRRAKRDRTELEKELKKGKRANERVRSRV